MCNGMKMTHGMLKHLEPDAIEQGISVYTLVRRIVMEHYNSQNTSNKDQGELIEGTKMRKKQDRKTFLYSR